MCSTSVKLVQVSGMTSEEKLKYMHHPYIPQSSTYCGIVDTHTEHAYAIDILIAKSTVFEFWTQFAMPLSDSQAVALSASERPATGRPLCWSSLRRRDF